MILRLVPNDTTVPFLSFRKIAIALSIVLALSTVGLLVTKGLNFGIDFVGGTQIQIQTEKAPAIADMRAALKSAGLDLEIQEFGAPNEFVLRAPVTDQEGAGILSKAIANAVEGYAGGVEIRGVEYVGPQVGAELRKKGILAVLVSLAAILVYISARFEFRYGMGAIVALTHDVFLTVGVYSLMQREVSLPVLAALLTVIGYSLNDTIVVFDRVRENRRRYRKKSMMEVLNLSMNDMLARTLMTSLTTLVVLIALFFFGGEAIHEFAFTLMFGVIVGTYSSIFIASPVVLALEKYYQRKPEDEKEEGNVEKNA